MSTDENKASDLEAHFLNPLSFLDEISDEISSEEENLAQLYNSTIQQLPIIDDFYRDRQKVNSGGMKNIELAWDIATSRKLALAWPKNCDMGLKDKIIFLNEARASAVLVHPNIIPVYQVGRDKNNIPLFAMKWLDGMNLEQYLKSHHHPHSQDIQYSLNAFIKVCEAIEYAHANGVLHLDIKPSNIQLGDFGEVLVLDWGLARMTKIDHFSAKEMDIHQSIERFLESRVRGTIDYISPEQKAGDPPHISMDIYALGIVIKEILTFCKSEISSLDRTSIQAIINKASAAEPSKRYQSVSELKKDVEGFLLGFAVTAERPSLLKLIRLFIYRHKPVFSTALIALITLFIFSLVFIINLRQSEIKERTSRLVAEQALKDLENENKVKISLLDQLSHRVADEQRIQQQRLNFQEAIKNLEYLTTLDSKNSSVWFQLARLKLGVLDFEGALYCYEKSEELDPVKNHHSQTVKNVISKYRKQEAWTNADYLNFLKDLNKLEYIEATFCKNIYSQMTIADELNFFIEAIKVRNPNITFKYQLNEHSIDLDFSHQTRHINFSVAAGLGVEKLNLSHTKNLSLKFFQNESLKSLDISSSDIDSLHDIYSLLELNANKLNTDELNGHHKLWRELRKLDLSGCQLKSWAFLRFCENLEELNLSHSNVHLSYLKHLKKLKSLKLDNSQKLNSSLQKLADKIKVGITYIE